jgi:hypothetical protein
VARAQICFRDAKGIPANSEGQREFGDLVMSGAAAERRVAFSDPRIFTWGSWCRWVSMREPSGVFIRLWDANLQGRLPLTHSISVHGLVIPALECILGLEYGLDFRRRHTSAVVASPRHSFHTQVLDTEKQMRRPNGYLPAHPHPLDNLLLLVIPLFQTDLPTQLPPLCDPLLLHPP